MQLKEYTFNYYKRSQNDWPSIICTYPSSYQNLSRVDKEFNTVLNSFICTIKYLKHTERFVRCTLSQKIIGQASDLQYEIWIALSEENFKDYTQNYNHEYKEKIYPGIISNDFLPYDNTKGIPVSVILKIGKLRPAIIPNHNVDHAFVMNFYTGITKLEAEDRIAEIKGIINDLELPSVQKKTWWRFWFPTPK